MNRFSTNTNLNTLWKRITFVCGNHGEDYSNQMKLVDVQRSEFYENRRKESLRSDAFYSCPLYKKYYNVLNGEKSCPNRLPYSDALKVVDWISSLEANEDIYGMMPYLIGRQGNLSGKGIQFTIVDQKEENNEAYYTVAVINKKSLNS